MPIATASAAIPTRTMRVGLGGVAVAESDRIRLIRNEVEAAFVSEPFDPGALSSIPVFDEELVLITAREAPAPRGAAHLDGCTMVALGS
jgi:DNA-binding transcriptional LysR family regulator